MKPFAADKEGKQKDQSARTEVSKSDILIRRRQVRGAPNRLKEHAGNSNVECELCQPFSDIKVDKVNFRGKKSQPYQEK